MSAEFVEYRGYRQGDDTKRIDWKLLARTDRAYIRLSQERTLLPTALMVDASASLAFPLFVASGGELYALHIVDQGELNPDPDKLLVEDPEAAAVRRPMSPSTSATYLERFGAWRAQLARDWRHAGAAYTMVVTARESLRHSIRRITAQTGTTGMGAR